MKKHIIRARIDRKFYVCLAVRAVDRASARQIALARLGKQLERLNWRGIGVTLGLPLPWCETGSAYAGFGTGHDCVDCGKDTNRSGEYYMISDELWTAAGMNSGMLCLACLEKRIGRQLQFADFTHIVPEAWPKHMARRRNNSRLTIKSR